MSRLARGGSWLAWEGAALSWRMIVGHYSDITGLETVDLDGLGIELETLLLVDKEFLHILALIALKLDNFTHGGVRHDGSIASWGPSVSRKFPGRCGARCVAVWTYRISS